MTAPTLARYDVLDVSDAAAVAAYEEAFYRGFVRVTTNRLIRDLWRWDHDARRLAARIPYDEQTVFLERDASGAIETAMATNVAMRAWQASAFGFGDGIDTTGCCELLTFFTAGDHRLEQKLRFVHACFSDLRSRGFHTAYATTAARPLPSYIHIGGELLAEREIQGEMRYLLRFSLERAWMRRRPMR